MIQRRLAVDEQLAEDRQQAAVEAHFTAKRQRCSGSAGQTVGRQRAQQPAAVGNVQRVMGGGSAPLPAEPRAELEDVAVETSPCRHFRRWSALHSSRVCSDQRGANFPAQASGRGLPQNCETCCSSRPAPSGAPPSHGWLRGHVEFGLNPLTLMRDGHARRGRMYRARWSGASLLAARSAAPFGRFWWYLR